jgi:hypothetical protein
MAKARSNIDPKSMETIASLRLNAAEPGGKEKPIELILCRPYPVDTGEWECRFSIVGLLEDMPPTRNADSWRALVLATNFMRMHLEMMIDCGGRLTDPASGRDINVADIFTKAGNERAGR